MRSMKLLSLVIALTLTASSASRAQSVGSVCKDGSSSATAGRGACSGHGGVDAKATSKAMKAAGKAASKAQKDAAKDAKKAAKSEEKGETKAEKKAEKAEMVHCMDGTTSNGGRGACSGHGGVSKAPMPAPMPAPAPRGRDNDRGNASNSTRGSGAREDNDPRGAIAKCKDGMYSHATHRQGACSNHGGVGSWIGQ